MTKIAINNDKFDQTYFHIDSSEYDFWLINSATPIYSPDMLALWRGTMWGKGLSSREKGMNEKRREREKMRGEQKWDGMITEEASTGRVRCLDNTMNVDFSRIILLSRAHMKCIVYQYREGVTSV